MEICPSRPSPPGLAPHRLSPMPTDHVRDAVETVTMQTRHQVARGHTRALHLQRRRVTTDGRDVTRCWRVATKVCEDARARVIAGTGVGGQCIIALPDATYELGVPAEPAQVWHISMSAIRSASEMMRGRRTLA